MISKTNAILLYGVIISIFYFLIPWIKNNTIYLNRWDEAVYYNINQNIRENGIIPSKLNYLGGIPNYIYPDLYLNLNNLQSFLDADFNLKDASLSLQLVMFFSLLIGSYFLYCIVFEATDIKYISLLSGLIFLFLPLIRYRLFSLNATFYSEFIGISFILLFIYYLLKYNKSNNKRYLILSIWFYSISFFTHQLTFFISTIILICHLITSGEFRKNVRIYILFGISGLLVNSVYLTKLPLLEKLSSLSGLDISEKFGENTIKTISFQDLSTAITTIAFAISVIGIIEIFINVRYKRLRFISLFATILYLSIFSYKLGLNLPVAFRFDAFLIITIPICFSAILYRLNNKVIYLFSFLIFISILSVNSISITNGFSISELESARKGLNYLNCKNTVSYFRLAPWIPTLSSSDVYYAHVDIYNAHQDKMDRNIDMFSQNLGLEKRLKLFYDNNIDCLVYEKNILFEDNIRIKGWEKWRYSDLYSLGLNYYEDENLVVFRVH